MIALIADVGAIEGWRSFKMKDGTVCWRDEHNYPMAEGEKLSQHAKVSLIEKYRIAVVPSVNGWLASIGTRPSELGDTVAEAVLLAVRAHRGAGK